MGWQGRPLDAGGRLRPRFLNALTTKILATKLHIPPVRAAAIARPALLKRLDNGITGRLTLVSAPAGFGKTTLVSSWLAHCGRPAAWLSLDEGDNELARFLAYCVSALQTVEHPQDTALRIGREAYGVIQSARLPELETILAGLVSEITAFGAQVIFCMDNYHVIQAAAVHEVLVFLLEYLPENLHLVLLTRADPPLPLARLRGRGQVNEIRAVDLRFTAQESVEFLERLIGAPLAPEASASLAEATEGWVTGLQLAGLSMQNLDTQNTARFIKNFSGRHHLILDYLMDEVIAHQSERVASFLLRTSVLERMTGSLCAALLAEGDPSDAPSAQMAIDAGSLLEELYHANLFLTPLDEEHRWFRHHQLFGDLLRSRLGQVWPGLESELHHRAAAWFEENGFMTEAVSHALASGDDDLAVDAMERAVRQIATWSSLDVVTLRGWLRELPEMVLRSRPGLRLFESRALCAAGYWESGITILRELETSLRNDPGILDAERLLMQVLADRASIAAVQGEVSQAVQYARDTLATLLPDDHGMRIRVMAVSGMALTRAGDVEEAARQFSQVIQLVRETGADFMAVPLVCNLAEVQFVQGHLGQAQETCQQALEMGTMDGKPAAITGYAGVVLSRVCYERNQLAAAEDHILTGLDRLAEGGSADSFGTMHAQLALVRVARGDLEGAQRTVSRAIEIANECNIERISMLTAAYQARVWLDSGDQTRALEWASTYCQSGPVEYLREFEELTMTRILLADDRPTEALAVLDAMLPPAEKAGRRHVVVHVQALRALGLGSLDGNGAGAALEALRAALKGAGSEGYVRVFIEGGHPMQALLTQISADRSSPFDVRDLLAGFVAVPVSIDSQPSSLIESLTGREMEILHLLGEGMSNAEICERLHISLPTVKTHTRNIYMKLGVSKRRQAVAAARAIGLLPPG